MTARVGRVDDVIGRFTRLPWELRDRIFEYAGSLTRLLHGELPLPLTRQQTRLLVVECFAQDSVAAIKYLPHRHTIIWEVLFVSSAAMNAAARTNFKVSTAALAVLDEPETEWPELVDALNSEAIAFPEMHPAIIAAIDRLPKTTRSVPCGRELGFRMPTTCMLLCTAATVGHLDAVRDLSALVLSQPRWTATNALRYAIQNNHVLIQEFLLETGSPRLIDIRQVAPWCSTQVAREICQRFPNQIAGLDATMLSNLFKQQRYDSVWWMLEVVPVDNRSLVFANLQTLAVVHGQWELVQHAVDHQIGGPVSNSAMELAAINGNIDTMDWMHQRGIGGCTSNAMDHAASHGDLRIVTWLHETCGESGTFNAVDRAACSGHLEVIKYLHSKCGLVCTLEGLLSSARFGHFETFKYICGTFAKTKDIAGCVGEAVRQGNLWILEFYLETYRPHIETLNGFMDLALTGGQVFIADWLESVHGATADINMMTNAAGSGELQSVQWLHNRIRGRYSSWSLELASQSGFVDIVRYLVEVCGSYVTTKTCELGTLSVIKFLYENIPNIEWSHIDLKKIKKSAREWLAKRIVQQQQ